MAGGDWIKMRSDIHSDPKVIAIAEYLAAQPEFNRWALGATIADNTLKAALTPRAYHVVTLGIAIGGLLVTWSVTRRDGLRDGDDLIIQHCTLDTISRLSGIPHFGQAMGHVGWAVEEGGSSTRFPKCLIHLTSPEERAREAATERKRKQRERERDEQSDTSRDSHNDVTHRVEEKRRELKEAAPTNGASPSGPVFGEGLSLLTSAKVPEAQARQFLGMLLGSWEERDVLEALTASVGKADPRAYARKILSSKPKKVKPPPGTEKVLAELRRQHGDAVVITRDQKAFWHPSLQMRWSLTGERMASV